MIKKIINKYGSVSKIKFYYQRSITDFNMRNKISNNLAKKIGKCNFEGKSILDNINYENTLNANGFVNFGEVINHEKIKIITDKLKHLKCFDPFRPKLGMFKFEDVNNNVHVANYRREDLLSIPEILNIANDAKILNIVQDFLGAKPTISNINCWWSVAGKEQAEQAQLFHRDVDDYRFCKLFIYLTDVKKNDGPHVYVENSHSSNTLTKIRRYSDNEIENEFGKKHINFFTGSKGSMFLVNTYGFHKGLLPQNNNRLLLQVQYSLNPIGIESYVPKNIGNHAYNEYVNRLILK